MKGGANCEATMTQINQSGSWVVSASRLAVTESVSNPGATAMHERVLA
jgi:hypothetical protein